MAAPAYLEFEKPLAELQRQIEHLRQLASAVGRRDE